MLEINAGKIEVHCDECGQQILKMDDCIVLWREEVPQVTFIHNTVCDPGLRPPVRPGWRTRNLRQFLEDLKSDLK